MKKKAIWLIDDDPIYKIVMKKIITKLGLLDTTTTFSNGKEALAALELAIQNQNGIPNLILLDIEMPVMDGWEFMNEIQKLERDCLKNTTIYICSSSIAVEDKDEAQKNCLISGYMSKPIKIEDLSLIL